MGTNRTPENRGDEIKGGGNPFVDYDFYLHPERSNQMPPKKKEKSGASVPRRPSQRPVQSASKTAHKKSPSSGGKRTSAVRPPRSGGGKRPAPDKPWYIRAREAIVRFYSTRRPLKVTLTVVIALILIAAIVILSFTYGILGKMNTGGDDDESRNAVFENESNFATMTDPTSQSFRAMLKEWATTGEKMHSKNVVNILLMGMDGSNENVNSAAHSDAMILASINKKTQTITLASVYRDCLTYANINGRDRYLKLTEVSIFDTLGATVETIENDFKIEIDDYVAVNFNTFPKVIDAVGGVQIEITDAEYRWLLSREGVDVGGSGLRTLDGQQALAYSRIRYLDSDIARTNRQRNVLTSLLNASRNASMSQITSMLDVLLPNVATSMSRTGILSLATQALTGQWYNYQIKSVDIPSEEARYGQNGVDTSVSSNVWVWLVDYPLAAQEMQLALYGDTNIELTEGRVTAIDLYLGRSGSGSSGGGSGGDSDDGGEEPSRTYQEESTTLEPVSEEPATEPETESEPDTAPEEPGEEESEDQTRPPASEPDAPGEDVSGEG